MSLVVEVYKGESGKCKIELKGRLDTTTSALFDEKITAVDPAEFPIQTVDLSGLSYVSSAGVRSLFKAKKRLTESGGQLLLLKPQPQVRKVFEIIKALPTSAIFANEEEMDRYLDAMQKQSVD